MELFSISLKKQVFSMVSGHSEIKKQFFTRNLNKFSFSSEMGYLKRTYRKNERRYRYSTNIPNEKSLKPGYSNSHQNVFTHNISFIRTHFLYT